MQVPKLVLLILVNVERALRLNASEICLFFETIVGAYYLRSHVKLPSAMGLSTRFNSDRESCSALAERIKVKPSLLVSLSTNSEGMNHDDQSFSSSCWRIQMSFKANLLKCNSCSLSVSSSIITTCKHQASTSCLQPDSALRTTGRNCSELKRLLQILPS